MELVKGLHSGNEIWPLLYLVMKEINVKIFDLASNPRLFNYSTLVIQYMSLFNLIILYHSM